MAVLPTFLEELGISEFSWNLVLHILQQLSMSQSLANLPKVW